jgi:hypothetical protein
LCTCSSCPTLENTPTPICRGDNCQGCMMTCVDACKELGCTGPPTRFDGCTD